ncbi:PROTEIN PATRONUS 2 [Salix viminalis]|uniref:PROTEIN PATRONUS 2 n=1 Tax=Salix viminalis TaxID=40686 RepID=A0A9Q0SAV2_SALVM|nr:PROTEIN PATRONUS 2 [Salix viminalis]
MATRVTQTPLIIQDENLGVSRKKVGLDVSVKKYETATKKSGGFALGNRKALNDITNKAVVRQETSSRKKNVQKEEINNVAEERFLHDHNKCIEEKETTSISSFLDLVLPGHDSVSSTAVNPGVKQTDPDSRFCPEPKELPMTVFSDWFESSTQRHSPPCSPIHWDSQPCSPFSWQSEAVEYVLKPESDV